MEGAEADVGEGVNALTADTAGGPAEIPNPKLQTWNLEAGTRAKRAPTARQHERTTARGALVRAAEFDQLGLGQILNKAMNGGHRDGVCRSHQSIADFQNRASPIDEVD